MAAAARLLALAAASWTAGGAGAARAQTKISQETAKYRDKPNGTQMCSNCTHFEPPDACHLVAGKISPKGWCAFYAPKPASK